jgi:hypothetical protein
MTLIIEANTCHTEQRPGNVRSSYTNALKIFPSNSLLASGDAKVRGLPDFARQSVTLELLALTHVLAAGYQLPQPHSFPELGHRACLGALGKIPPTLW